MLKYQKMTILGIMSGSSLDGIDMALCEFSGSPDRLKWKITQAICVPMPADWKIRLTTLPNSSAMELALADYEFGYFIGELCHKHFGNERIDYIASHGHTVFHSPDKGMTFQLGNGAAIAGRSGVSVICDFRSMDVAAGGQGAPIVSCLDRYLFKEYFILANLGGILNISVNYPDKTFAWDVCPCNQLLNHIAARIGLPYDPQGRLASKGLVQNELLRSMLNDPYFEQKAPKTLDNQYITDRFIPILDGFNCSNEDKLRTAVESIVRTVSKELHHILGSTNSKESLPKILLSGGGAHNTFLVNQLRKSLPQAEVIVPENMLVDFKEAFLMAFLGFLRVMETENTLSSATGAKMNTIGGCIYKTPEHERGK